MFKVGQLIKSPGERLGGIEFLPRAVVLATEKQDRAKRAMWPLGASQHSRARLPLLVGLLLAFGVAPAHGEYLAYSITQIDKSPLP